MLLADQVARKKAIIKLENPERDLTYGNTKSWNYLETYI